MIDREKVIKGLKCIGGYMHMEANPCAECGYNECQTYAVCVGEVARDALELLREQEAPQWISIKDRLPEPPAQCLVYSAIAIGPRMMEIANYTELGWMTAAYAHFPGITHWMPLPDQPEEASRDA